MNFKSEIELARYIESMNGTLYLVGGAVRDEIMGIQSSDHDYMITGLNIDDIPFERIAGKEFSVFLVKINNKDCEVALARKEKKQGQGYKGFEFFTDSKVKVKEDLSRRDLTINSIAKNVLTQEIIDSFNGIDDIKNKILKHTTDAFKEDPLRVFRVARFSAKFGFKIADETKKLMEQLIPELHTISKERIWLELEKVLNTDKPSVFFKTLKEINALSVFFKEINDLNVPDKHDGTAFDHTMKIIDFGDSAIERFGILCHDFGKGRTPKEYHPSHYKHDKLGKEVVIDFCERLKIPNRFKKFGIICAKEHMRFSRSYEMRPGKFLQMVLNLGEDNFHKLWRVSFKDACYREGSDVLKEIKKFKYIRDLANIVFNIEMDITGKSLIEQGYKEGIELGQLLLQKRIEAFVKERKEYEKKYPFNMA